ncbi:MAG: hypothetical protein UT66_C0022G0008 [candidate division CPR2 bacterium GW2011_GWC1_39_9]|uniref:Uncharacterized protein n=1 Tax=candidate division CPR2 bacterium GW2011_GWC2_39_10 TaxID=1618345 RepID=A0A0G0M3B5_UNCC2|nr:MAG: hypothetical protein UT18_C0007G0106 [candidate division CPR2 bacterium GW2011_GWC2_39_10]KKR34515.1 MAG: hypothetical protein UT66_C0022G0008 [candidate division CPR2 bacterium GW2011_GWC1_39_9]
MANGDKSVFAHTYKYLLEKSFPNILHATIFACGIDRKPTIDIGGLVRISTEDYLSVATILLLANSLAEDDPRIAFIDLVKQSKIVELNGQRYIDIPSLDKKRNRSSKPSK